MNRSLALFLRICVVLFGLGALAFLIWEPQVEGRNARASQFEIYFQDPFLAYVYVGSIPFFVALYRAFEILGEAGRGRMDSPGTVKSMRAIKRCALALIGFIFGGLIFILMNDSDDHAGGVFIGLVLTLGSIVVAFAASRLETTLRNRLEHRILPNLPA